MLMRKVYKHLLAGLFLCSATLADAATMSFTTAKTAGEPFAIALNPGLTVTVTWADGTTEEFVSDGSLQTLTLASQKFTIETDAEVTSLYVAGNELTFMDLTNTSNTLKKLYCGNNALTTLNLSSFKNLNEVDAQGNKLTTLKVYGPENVNGTNNQLSSFAATQFARLKQLYLADNLLKGMSTSQMTSLEYLFVQRNAIKTLRLNKCAALKVASLSDNAVTTFDISGISSLKELWLGGNTLDELDITAADSLEWLVTPGTNLKTILWNNACKKTLTYADLSNNRLFFNSFPTVRNNEVLTTAILAPQNPYPLVEAGYVYAGIENNWSSAKLQPMSTNGWGSTSAPLLTITDSEGNTLTEGSDSTACDYHNYLRRITFWPSAVGKTVTIVATSNYYTDITLTTTPFLVTTATGIEGVKADESNRKADVYYNLNGQRIEKPSHGVYIANGKKVIIR